MKKSIKEITENRIKQGVKISRQESFNLIEKNSLTNNTGCPSKYGSCPMMFCYIKPGTSKTCTTCGKVFSTPNITL